MPIPSDPPRREAKAEAAASSAPHSVTPAYPMSRFLTDWRVGRFRSGGFLFRVCHMWGHLEKERDQASQQAPSGNGCPLVFTYAAESFLDSDPLHSHHRRLPHLFLWPIQPGWSSMGFH